ncbi:hypothetical protein AB5I41_03905 [Sphingomonas sp. MMS24-JH45]
MATITRSAVIVPASASTAICRPAWRSIRVAATPVRMSSPRRPWSADQRAIALAHRPIVVGRRILIGQPVAQ